MKTKPSIYLCDNRAVTRETYNTHKLARVARRLENADTHCRDDKVRIFKLTHECVDGVLREWCGPATFTLYQNDEIWAWGRDSIQGALDADCYRGRWWDMYAPIEWDSKNAKVWTLLRGYQP